MRFMTRGSPLRALVAVAACFACLALGPPPASAQIDAGFRFKYDFDAKTLDPVITTTLYRLEEVPVFSSLDVWGFGGLRIDKDGNQVPLVGVGLVKGFKVAKNATGFIGIQAQFVQGRPTTGGILTGIDIMKTEASSMAVGPMWSPGRPVAFGVMYNRRL